MLGSVTLPPSHSHTLFVTSKPLAGMTPFLPHTLLALTAVLSLSIAALVPVPPSLDPFYNPPAGFEAEEPGTILRNRTVDPALFGLLPNGAEGYQLLYRTSAIDGSAIADVTTVFVPL